MATPTPLGILPYVIPEENHVSSLMMMSLRQFTDEARTLRIGTLFNNIMPLLIQPTLEDQERHLLMKVIDRVFFKLDERSSIDEDYYARVED